VSLRQYRAKRKFHQTSEPEGTIRAAGGPLRFVVQKHQASHLHYDLRLEADGALKSWAVPKGPPENAAEKRLAVLVEDHPLDYRTFEGVIPKGNYGAGSVMVWDEGTYHAPGASARDASEKVVLDGLEKGNFHFVLHFGQNESRSGKRLAPYQEGRRAELEAAAGPNGSLGAERPNHARNRPRHPGARRWGCMGRNRLRHRIQRQDAAKHRPDAGDPRG
jgi:DNA ligase D-like protein (predicted 3'-phosphoesterase)